MKTLTKHNTTTLVLLNEKELYCRLTYVYDGVDLALIKVKIYGVNKKDQFKINLWSLLGKEGLAKLLRDCWEDEVKYKMDEDFDEVDTVSLEDLLAAATYYDNLILER
jgi:hypothetical protein